MTNKLGVYSKRQTIAFFLIMRKSMLRKKGEKKRMKKTGKYVLLSRENWKYVTAVNS